MLTEKDYCDYDTCVALKELGFNEYCRGYFDPLCKIFNETSYLKGWNNTEGLDCGVLSCPSLYEVQKWLREEKKIDVGATWDNDEDNWFTYIKQMGFPDWSGTSVSHSCYPSYEEALSEGIKETIKILRDERID